MKQCSGKFTKETCTAIVHTSNALFKISEYCLHDLDAKYVVLGKFQNDCLEAQFGQHRQLARGKYDVLLRQVFECEKYFVCPPWSRSYSKQLFLELRCI